MSPDELNKLMADCAKDAVVTAADEFNIVLDHSPASVALVDDILLSFVDKYHDLALEDEAVFTICNIFGAYVGEILKAQLAGEWIYDQSNPKAPVEAPKTQRQPIRPGATLKPTAHHLYAAHKDL